MKFTQEHCQFNIYDCRFFRQCYKLQWRSEKNSAQTHTLYIELWIYVHFTGKLSRAFVPSTAALSLHFGCDIFIPSHFYAIQQKYKQKCKFEMEWIEFLIKFIEEKNAIQWMKRGTDINCCFVEQTIRIVVDDRNKVHFQCNYWMYTESEKERRRQCLSESFPCFSHALFIHNDSFFILCWLHRCCFSIWATEILCECN